jgi:probable rRNA maturation factor
VSSETGSKYPGFVQSMLHGACEMLEHKLSELSVVLVGDRTMSALHERYLDEIGPTDVLTFPVDCDARGRCTSGEVYVCVPEARRRAREMGTEVKHELLLYALHGLLHLAGFDDRTARQYQRMHRMEDSILRRLGVGAVFQPETRA